MPVSTISRTSRSALKKQSMSLKSHNGKAISRLQADCASLLSQNWRGNFQQKVRLGRRTLSHPWWCCMIRSHPMTFCRWWQNPWVFLCRICWRVRGIDWFMCVLSNFFPMHAWYRAELDYVCRWKKHFVTEWSGRIMYSLRSVMLCAFCELDCRPWTGQLHHSCSWGPQV